MLKKRSRCSHLPCHGHQCKCSTLCWAFISTSSTWAQLSFAAAKSTHNLPFLCKKKIVTFMHAWILSLLGVHGISSELIKWACFWLEGSGLMVQPQLCRWLLQDTQPIWGSTSKLTWMYCWTCSSRCRERDRECVCEILSVWENKTIPLQKLQRYCSPKQRAIWISFSSGWV